jgi:hypothetical protein
MDPKPQRYEITTLADFLKVPAERRQDCLTDFLMWLAMHEQARQMTEFKDIRFPMDQFVWIDDGQQGPILRIAVHNKGPKTTN